VGQQLSGKAARAIYAKFVGLFERNSVEPKQILTLENQVLRDAGLSWAKVSYIKDLAVKVLSQELALETLAEFEDKKVIEALTTVKGVGPWTAEMFLIFTLGRENVFSYGDLGLKRGMESVYGLKDPSIEQMEQIVTPWSPFKSYGSIALWHALE
jgi:DNA-3-methyladenine glycosylase II